MVGVDTAVTSASVADEESISNDVIVRVLLTFSESSVTFIVQSE